MHPFQSSPQLQPTINTEVHWLFLWIFLRQVSRQSSVLKFDSDYLWYSLHYQDTHTFVFFTVMCLSYFYIAYIPNYSIITNTSKIFTELILKIRRNEKRQLNITKIRMLLEKLFIALKIFHKIKKKSRVNMINWHTGVYLNIPVAQHFPSTSVSSLWELT